MTWQRDALGPEHPDYLKSVTGLALVLKRRGENAAAEPLYREVIAVQRRAFGEDHPDLATNLNNLGMLLLTMGKLDEAEPLVREGLAIRRRVLGPDHSETIALVHNLGIVHYNRGAFDTAAHLLGEAAEHWERLHGPESVFAGTARKNQADALRDGGRSDASLALYRRSLSVFREALSPGHPRTAGTLVGYGAAL